MTPLDREMGGHPGEGSGIARFPLGLGATRTGTEYMVLRLLRNFSVASMNKLSMGVFWERRSFIWREMGAETHGPCVASGQISEWPPLCPVPSPSLTPLGLQDKIWALHSTLVSLIPSVQVQTIDIWGQITHCGVWNSTPGLHP